METDSGLDIDALRIVSEGVHRLGPGDRAFSWSSIISALLDYIVPTWLHVLVDGTHRGRRRQ